MTIQSLRKKGAEGFTLIELLVVVLIIGILAAIAVPQYFKVVEKGKAAEALQWVGTVQGAQESYLAQYGSYATNVSNLPVGIQSTLNNFSEALGAGAVNNVPTWGVTLTRNAAPAVYGAYSVIWSGPPGVFACSGGNDVSACNSDLMPQ